MADSTVKVAVPWTMVPVKFSASSTEIQRAAPRLGQHSREILQEIGYPPAEIEALVEAGNIAAEG